jgi:hypothetical protein
MKITKKILVSMCIFMVMAASGLEAHAYVKNIDASKPAAPQNQPFITVWIHGISLFSPNKHDIGLKPFCELTGNKGLLRVGCLLNEYAPDRFPFEHIYAYSWTGRFDYRECDRASQELYWSLKGLVDDYKATYGYEPKIRIITFSYGIQVALRLAKIEDSSKLSVDELLIMAGPVVKGLSDFAKDPMFKRIFNLHALLDVVQVVDPQGFVCSCASCPLFTTRCLNGNSNLIQARARINGHSFGHFGFIGRKFLAALPAVLDGLNELADSQDSPSVCGKKAMYILNVYTTARLAKLHMCKKAR